MGCQGEGMEQGEKMNIRTEREKTIHGTIYNICLGFSSVENIIFYEENLSCPRPSYTLPLTVSTREIFECDTKIESEEYPIEDSLDQNGLRLSQYIGKPIGNITNRRGKGPKIGYFRGGK